MAVTPLKSKILVIENQPDVLNAIVRLLQRVGYEVFATQTGAEGIRLARNDEFDLITVDVDLPDVSGFEVCRHLKQDFRFYRTPVIFISGRLSGEDCRRAFELGAADFIFKPFDPFIFVSQIMSHVKPAQT